MEKNNYCAVTQQERRKARLEKMLSEYFSDVGNDPDIERYYKQKLKALKSFIVSQRNNYEPDFCVAYAMVAAEARYTRRRLCGTYLYRVTCKLAARIRYTVPDKELSAIVTGCAEGGELTRRQEDILMMLLHCMGKYTGQR